MTFKPLDPYEENITTLEAHKELKDRSQLLLYHIAEKRPKIQRGVYLEEEEIASFFNKIEDVIEVIEALTGFDINVEEKRGLQEAEEKFNKALARLEELPSLRRLEDQSNLFLETFNLAEEGALVSREIAEGLQ